ncbi:hypothetical protein [Pseudonocardia sp.]|uniref:hypothetical protein n=1 Tax=Pseudonocardia sp. TaxID=60912 RepID=UPI003D0A4A4C
MIPAGALAALVAALVPLAAAPAPETLCTVSDRRLIELSGLSADADGIWAVADSGRRTEVHRLDPRTCAILETRSAAIDPRDAEDLAVGPDGALWVADIGDNRRRRDSVAVIVLPARGEPRLHRLAYPDGPHDAEALLVDGGGSPVILTKEAGRFAGIYRTAAPPEGDGPTPLVKAGEYRLPVSDTAGGPLGGLGSRLVTGAASSADRSVVAVRSYTDAWLHPVRDGDIVAALLSPPAVRVPLPGEPQGEAIAFLPDGTLLSGSERRDGVPGELRAVPGAAALVADASGLDASTPAADQVPGWLPATLGAAAVTGVLAIVTAGLALRRR